MEENKKTIAEMRHEVIDNTIRLENRLDDIIQTDMGFEIQWEEIEGEFPDETEVIIANEKGIKRFKKFFLDKINLERKFEIVKDIIKEDSEKSVPKDIWEKAKRIREIRNIFAHTLAPKYPEKPKTIKTAAIDFNCLIQEIEDWEKLYEEHKMLFEEVDKIITNLFYIKLDMTELENSKQK